jgi:methyltransferase
VVNPLHLYLGFLGLFAAERGVELALSRRNARRALARGAVEFGRGHYRPMVILHALFFAACAAEALLHPRPPPPAALLAAAGALLAQGLRWWSIASLGDRWNTRILVVPGDEPVTRGPYRRLRHPNYLAVVLEMALVPLAWGSWRTALAFSVGNALLLAVRIPAESRAVHAWAPAVPAPRPPAPHLERVLPAPPGPDLDRRARRGGAGGRP